jgi:hypothetical protein
MAAETVREEFYMRKRTFAGVVAGLLFAVGGVALEAHGSEMDEGTMITFAQPVEIPGQVLGPGTYYFVRIDHGNSPDVNLIQIFNSDQTRVIATIHTATAERLDASGKTVLTFAETAKDAPLALRSWFYPGSLEGHEFLYPKREERHVEEARQIAVAADENGEVPLRGVSGD